MSKEVSLPVSSDRLSLEGGNINRPWYSTFKKLASNSNQAFRDIEALRDQIPEELVTGAAGLAWLGMANLFGVYQGLNAGSYDESRLYFNPGTFTSSDGTRVLNFTTPIMVDVGTVGVQNGGAPVGYSEWLGGMAEGSPSSPVGLSFYSIQKDDDPTAIAILASSYIFYGDVAPHIPAGWTLIRKMHFSVVYDVGRGTHWNGFPDFFTDIDNSFTIFSKAGDSTEFQALGVGAATSFTPVSLTDWLTDGARTALIYYKISPTGSAGTGYLRPPGQGDGFAVGEVGAANTIYGFAWMKVDSIRNLEYKISGGARMNIFVQGYKFDDPT